MTAQQELVRVAMPFMMLWQEMVGLPSSHCRPPTRDVREKYRD
ncbi:MAG: hypothetical protein ACOYNY_04495 [Caldilineaceae bacterium]